MSGDGESKAFEVERRVQLHRPMPDGFSRLKEYLLIEDIYFTIDPIKRVRYAEIAWEMKDGVEIDYMKKDGKPKCLGKVTSKKGVSGEVAEYETVVGDPRLLAQIWGDPEVLVVTGSRTAYSNGNIIITHDKVHRLGDFTEFEIIAETDEQREEASKEVERFVSSLGILKSEYKRPYPHQILQLEILNDVHRTAVTRKKHSVPKWASFYKCSPKITRELCEELEKYGWMYETREGFWEPVEMGQEEAQKKLSEGSMTAGTLEPMGNYVEGIVAGIRPLCPALEVRKVAPKVQTTEQIPPLMVEAFSGARTSVQSARTETVAAIVNPSQPPAPEKPQELPKP
jgi:hypothetical protein